MKLLPLPNEKVTETAKNEERRFLSILLKYKELVGKTMSSGLTYEFLQEKIHAEFFETILKYFDKYEGSLLTRAAFESIVAKKLPDEDAARYRSYFDSVYSEMVQPDEFEFLRRSIENRYVQRCAYTIIHKYFDRVLNATSDQRAVVESLQGEISGIKTLKKNTFNRATVCSEVLKNEVMPEIRERRENPEKFWGLMCGFKCLDSVYYGFLRGKYMVFLASEGGGKTTFMLNIARNMAMFGYNVVYVTIESDAKQISMRALTIHAAVNYNRILAGGKSNETGLSDWIMEELEKASKDLVDGPAGRLHLIQVLQGTSRKEILDIINRKRSYVPVDVVFIDYLDVVGKETNTPNRPDLDLAKVSEGFQAWGRENDILVATAQQMKSDKVREIFDKSDESAEMRIGVGDISGSKKISGSADYMFGLVIDQETKDRIYVWSTKARQGRSGEHYTLSYDPNSGRIEDLPDAGGYGEVAAAVKVMMDKPKRSEEPASGAQPPTSVPEGRQAPTAVSVEKLQNKPVEDDDFFLEDSDGRGN